MSRSRLAGYGERGPIRVNPNVPTQFRGIRVRQRLVKHEKVERKLRKPKKKGGEGLSYREAHGKALKAEHEGLTEKQIAQYEGKLGSIARHKPHRRGRTVSTL